MEEHSLLSRVQDLSDLELATLLCLTAEEHCIIDTEPDALDDLVHELRLVVSNVFGLSHAIIDCTEHTTLDDFAASILATPNPSSRSQSPIRTRHDSNNTSYFLQPPTFRSISRSTTHDTFTSDTRNIASVIIAKNLDEAPTQVQIQALELLRTKRIFTHTSVQSAPKRFLFIALVAGGEGPRLTRHLNDHMFISHFHDPEDGFPNLEDFSADDDDSISSVVRKREIDEQIEAADNPVFSAADINVLASKNEAVTVTAEIYAYMYHIVAFLRMHRAVNGGITPISTKYFEKLVKCLAPLHDLNFVTPSLVALAAKKIYPHRIKIVTPERERSMQWGSDLKAVTAALEGVGPELVIDDVLGMVEVPL